MCGLLDPFGCGGYCLGVSQLMLELLAFFADSFSWDCKDNFLWHFTGNKIIFINNLKVIMECTIWEEFWVFPGFVDAINCL